jgi:hypothetical protein
MKPVVVAQEANGNAPMENTTNRARSSAKVQPSSFERSAMRVRGILDVHGQAHHHDRQHRYGDAGSRASNRELQAP